MVNVAHIVLIFILAIIVIFFVIGVILSPTAQRTLEEQQKFVETFSLGIIKASEGSMDLTCSQTIDLQVDSDVITFYEYQADMVIKITEPEDVTEDIQFVIIAFLDDWTFDLGTDEDGDPVIINYPGDEGAELKFDFLSNREIKQGDTIAVHITFWEYSSGCVERNWEKKETLLKLVDTCPEEYLYAGFFKIENVDLGSPCPVVGDTTGTTSTTQPIPIPVPTPPPRTPTPPP